MKTASFLLCLNVFQWPTIENFHVGKMSFSLYLFMPQINTGNEINVIKSPEVAEVDDFLVKTSDSSLTDRR